MIWQPKVTAALLQFDMKWGLDPWGLKRSTSIQLTRSQIINVRNGDLNGKGSAIWSWLAALLYTRSLRSTTVKISWIASDTLSTKLWKNSWDATGINTDFSVALRCDSYQGGSEFSLASWSVTNDLSASRWGLHGARYRSNASGDTWFLRLFQGLGVYLEACKRLCSGNVH